MATDAYRPGHRSVRAGGVFIGDLNELAETLASKLVAKQAKNASTQTPKRCSLCRLCKILALESQSDLDDSGYMTLRSGRKVYKR